MSDKNSRKIYIWDGYGSGFWHVMTFLSTILMILGAATFLFSGMRIFYGDSWFVWFILAGCGIASIAFSIFCISLFPKWGTLVRRIRLAEARMEGAMSISEINRYEEREDRRGTEIKDTVSESVGRVGRDILETKSHIAKVEASMDKMKTDIRDYVNQTLNSVMTNPERDKRLNNMTHELEVMLGNKIASLNSTVRDLQTQMAWQNDVIMNAISNVGISSSTQVNPSSRSSGENLETESFFPNDTPGGFEKGQKNNVDEDKTSKEPVYEKNNVLPDDDDVISDAVDEDDEVFPSEPDEEDTDPDFDYGDDAPVPDYF